jgi:hypothetical protein
MDAVVANAALLSAVEIGLGSALHALRVPLAGHFLSLNQGFLTARAATKEVSKTLPAQASSISAALKSLSPAGKKLTPMLAISAQGLLLTLGLFVFGLNPLGVSVGLILLGAWAFVQPLALAYLLFGTPLLDALRAATKALGVSPDFPWVVLATAVALKAFLCLVVAVLVYKVPDTTVDRYLARLHRLSVRPARPRPGSPVWIALRDLMNPLFLFSLVLTSAFFVWADSPRSVVLWGLLRPIAGGFLLFLLIRLFPFERVFSKEGSVYRALSALRELR